ncbi:acyltransferase [Paraglaciecola sp.]|uniref:acyltransferase n=1 Tax=Paraglaciecola sp. TaxID=1920173 RepID=UPI00273D7A2E|nr:acyltransferase [Paraglaciecola sp.]MDP5032081.1 acyltransferase [Paraglaciecola sp.]
MRNILKVCLNKLAQLCALPAAATCWLETLLRRESELIFTFWTNVFAILPGLPGVFLRRGFYSLTLSQCSMDCYIGFGTMFCHRDSIVEPNVYLGNYCTVGSAFLGRNSLIGSRSSLLSGSQQHIHNDLTGEWEAFTAANIKRIHIGANVWIGEAAIIMANIGEGCQIAAGAVIANDTKDYVVLAGNPARFIKKLQSPVLPMPVESIEQQNVIEQSEKINA